MDRLKLIAFDDEDLGIIAAHVQDAVLKTGELQFDPANKRFIIELNRFVWETANPIAATKSYERRKTILHFERVNNVQSLALNQKQGDAVLSLLTLRYLNDQEGNSNPEGIIEIIFAGGATLRLSVECIEAQLTDMAGAWETNSLPIHEGDSNAS